MHGPLRRAYVPIWVARWLTRKQWDVSLSRPSVDRLPLLGIVRTIDEVTERLLHLKAL
jgi:hypothetical protein